MDKIKHIIDKIEKISQNTSSLEENGKTKTKFIATEDVIFKLTDTYATSFEEVVSNILSLSNNSEKFSENYIENKVQSVIAKILKNRLDRNSIEIITKKLLLELNDFTTELKVIVPLIGISIEAESYELGNIRLLKGNKKNIDKIFNEVKSIILTTQHTDEEKQFMIESQKQEFQKHLLNNVFACYSVVAESKMAKERAIIETRRVIDILRFSIPFLYHDDHRVNLSVWGDLSKQIRYIPMISKDKKSFSTQSDVVGLLYNYELNTKNIMTIEKLGISNVFNLLKKNYSILNDFEKTILKTIHWYATHTIQEELENKLLNLTTSLEALLTPRDNNPIGTAIAEGTAILIANGVEKRKALKKRMQELYRLRSAVSHGGKKTISEKDILDLRWIVGNLIIDVIERMDEFKTQKELLDWIEVQKLS